MRIHLLSCVLAAAAALSLPAPVARAESRDAATVTLGWQTEHADVVALVTVSDEAPVAPGEDREVVVRVEQPLKGDAAAGATIRIRLHDHGVGAAWRPLVPHLVFLRAVRAQDGSLVAHEPVSGAFSVRALEPGTAESRFPGLVAALRDTLDAGDPAALRALLVTWMEDADPGVAWSAATDFVRRSELHAGLTPAESARIVAAYARHPVGKNSKDALALAAAATRTPEAVRALVDSLLLADARRIRGPVAEGLRRMDLPEAERLLAARLADASPAQRCALLGALGVVGGKATAADVRALVADDDAAVRAEAVAALGGMARNARLRDPDARLGVVSTLAARLSGAPAADLPEDEVRALLWALAQLDEPGAFDAVRAVAKSESAPAAVRDYAARLLARPRQSLVLR